MTDDELFDLWCDACQQIQAARRDVFDQEAAKYDRWKDPYEPHGMGALMSAHYVLDKARANAWAIYDELKERPNSKLTMLVDDDERYDRYLDWRADIIERLGRAFSIPPIFKGGDPLDKHSIEYACEVTLEYIDTRPSG